MQSKLTI